jgi:O-methyltransferase
VTAQPTPSVEPRVSPELYLDLLKGALTRSIFDNHYRSIHPRKGTLKRRVYDVVRKTLASNGLVLAQLPPKQELAGPDIRTGGETLIGQPRLDNLQECIERVLAEGIPGDLVETGVWRGGAAIFMRGVLKAYGDTSRKVWAADSFRGLPRPDAGRYPADRHDTFWREDRLAVPVETVQANFARYKLLDEQVQFLIGWFRDTLPSAPIRQIAVLRLDGDMYESTMDGLRHLYPKVARGGFVIVDDYGSVEGCRQAVEDYRREHSIKESLQEVDDWQRACVYWRKQ